jgi:hypothetical protein
MRELFIYAKPKYGGIIKETPIPYAIYINVTKFQIVVNFLEERQDQKKCLSKLSMPG